MPRQLPWKVGDAAAKQTAARHKPAGSPAPSASTRSPAPSHRSTPTPKVESTPGTSRKARRSLACRSARSPSTSPPPEPLKEEFMIEGVDHDDRYRMVEDEFLAVAGEFTRHLHAAEYQRLKGLAKSQNADTIQNISRPVTGEMTDLVKRRHAALRTASKQRRGIAKTLGKRAARNRSDSEEEGEHVRQPLTSLQGLMDSPRKQMAGARPGGADASPSKRRRSDPEGGGVAGNGSMETHNRKNGASSVKFKWESSPDPGDDSLDGLLRRPPKPGLPRPAQAQGLLAGRPVAPEFRTRTQAQRSDAPNPFRRTTAATGQAPTQETSTRRRLDAPSHEEDDDFFSRLRARRAEQKRRRKTETQNKSIKTSESQDAALSGIPFI